MSSGVETRVQTVRPIAPWRPAPASAAALALHVAAPAWAAAVPEVWPWAAGAVACSHGLLALTGLWPNSQVLGPTLTRLPGPMPGAVALTFDDGPDPEVTPLVLDLLDRLGARATFFMIGCRARAHPALVRAVAARGHGVENHTMRHRLGFACLGLSAQRRELTEAQAVLADITGHAPTLARVPAGIRSPLTDPVLHGVGLRHVSWSRRGLDTRWTDPRRVIRRLASGVRGGDILLLHDGNAARTAGGRAVVLDTLPVLLSALADAGLRSVPVGEALSLSPAATVAPASPAPVLEPAARAFP